MRLAFTSRNRYPLLSSSSSALIPCHSSTIHSKLNSIHPRLINMSHSHDRPPSADCSYSDWERQDLVNKIKELQEKVNNHNNLSNNNKDHSVHSQSRTDISSSSNQAHQAKVEPNQTHPSSSTSTSSNPNLLINFSNPDPKPKKQFKSMDFSKVFQRKVALRFSYDGSYYSGLAIQNYQLNPNRISNPKPENNVLPTVEEILWKALCKSRLVDESKGMSGCGFERCGRTDKGVSAAGQVVSLWIRSRRIDMSQERFKEEEIRRFREEEKKRRELRNGNQVQDEVQVEMKGQDEEEKEWGFDQEPLLESNLEEQESNKPSIYSFGKSIENEEMTELPYLSLLNKILPDSIRINAWSPVRPDFSARFDCRYRHYKYFFTRGASHQLIPLVDPRINSVASTSKVTLDSSSNTNGNPSPSSSTKANTEEIRSTYTYPTNGTGPELSISKMRNAASRLLGEHDFRNLCKVDPTKQITNFIRRIDGVSIDLVGKVQVPFHLNPNLNRNDPSSNTTINENVYVLNLRGTAFLYHQVRHIAALLFLVGSRLEEPNVIDRLLNVKKGQVEEDWEKLIRRGLNVEKWIGNSNHDHDQDQYQDRDEFPTILPNSTADTKGGHTAASALNAVKNSFIKSSSSSGNDNVNPNSNYITQEELIKMNEILTTKSKSRSMKKFDGDDGLEEMNERIRENLENLDVFESKPSYEMAEDRPLMLWDCGFRESDVQWRSGGYDGPIDLDLLEKQNYQQDNLNHVSESSNGSIPKNMLISLETSSHSSTYLKHLEAFNSLHRHETKPQLSEPSIRSDFLVSSTRSLAINHSIWVKSLIDSEIKKHFLLSNPLFNGILRSSTFFQDSRLGLNLSEDDKDEDLDSEEDIGRKLRRSTVVPIGYGNSRPALEYTKLEKRKRDELVEEKNRRWREGTGKRKAEKKLIKGGDELNKGRELDGIKEKVKETEGIEKDDHSRKIEEEKEEFIKRPQPRVVDMDERKVRGGPRIMDREIERRFR